MGFITSLLSSLLIAAIFSATVTVTLNRTIFNFAYLKSKADEAHLVAELTQILPQVIARGQTENQAEAERLKGKIVQALQTTNTEAAINQYFTDLAAHYDTGAALPQLDLNQLAIEGRKIGLDLPEEVKPLSISAKADEQIKAATNQARKAEMASLLGVGLLFILLFLTSLRQRHYAGLIFVFFVSVLLQLALMGMVNAVPVRVLTQIRENEVQAQQFVPLAEKFVGSIAHDISTWFLRFAIFFGVLTALVIALSVVSHARHKTVKGSRKKLALSPN